MEKKQSHSSLMLGTNYRISEIQAAIGNFQLEKFPYFWLNAVKTQKTKKVLEKSKKLVLPFESKQHHSWYLYTTRSKDRTETGRNELMEELKKKGIGAEAYYVNPVHQMPFHRENSESVKLPETDKAS